MKSGGVHLEEADKDVKRAFGLRAYAKVNVL